jgi:hypothetical protein
VRAAGRVNATNCVSSPSPSAAPGSVSPPKVSPSPSLPTGSPGRRADGFSASDTEFSDTPVRSAICSIDRPCPRAEAIASTVAASSFDGPCGPRPRRPSVNAPPDRYAARHRHTVFSLTPNAPATSRWPAVPMPTSCTAATRRAVSSPVAQHHAALPHTNTAPSPASSSTSSTPTVTTRPSGCGSGSGGPWFTFAPTDPPQRFPTPEQVAARYAEFPIFHNARHRYFALGGRTPDQAEARADFTPTWPDPDRAVPCRLAQLAGHVEFIRLIRSDALLRVMSHNFRMPDELIYNYVHRQPRHLGSAAVGLPPRRRSHHLVRSSNDVLSQATSPSNTTSCHQPQALTGQRCAVIYHLAKLSPGV